MPDFLAIGHITKDVIPDGYSVGGTVTFAAVTAMRLGRSAAIFTSASQDLVLPPELEGVEVHILPATATSTFANIYHGSTRTQYLYARAQELQPGDLPESLKGCRLVHLGPLTREVDPMFVHAFGPGASIVVTPQGWMRQWNAHGLIRPRPWTEAVEILPYVRALVLSEQDIAGFEERLDSYIEMAPLTALTRGPLGARIYPRGRLPFESPAFAAPEIDPTGAGDVFAAAFVIRLDETGDAVEAARFANCVASFSIQAQGIHGIPTRAQVDARLGNSGFKVLDFGF